MSKRSRRPAREPRPQARVRGRWRRSRWPAVVIVLGLLAAGVWLWRRTPRQPGHPSGLDLPPGKAGREASELFKQKNYLESLPLFRQAIAEEPNRWRRHVDYAVALLSGVHQGARHLGLDEFAVRGSPERVLMVHEAIRQLDVAESLATAARDVQGLAWARGTHGQLMIAWGMPWDALVSYRQSEWADSTLEKFQGAADHIMLTMAHPLERDSP